jgi:hypothetical protein
MTKKHYDVEKDWEDNFDEEDYDYNEEYYEEERRYQKPKPRAKAKTHNQKPHQKVSHE